MSKSAINSALSPVEYLETYVFPSLLPAIEALLKQVSPPSPPSSISSTTKTIPSATTTPTTLPSSVMSSLLTSSHESLSPLHATKTNEESSSSPSSLSLDAPLHPILFLAQYLSRHNLNNSERSGSESFSTSFAAKIAMPLSSEELPSSFLNKE